MGGSSSSSEQKTQTTTTNIADAYKQWSYRDVLSLTDSVKDIGNRMTTVTNSPIGSTYINVGSGSQGAAGGGDTAGETGWSWKVLGGVALASAAGFYLLNKLRH